MSNEPSSTPTKGGMSQQMLGVPAAIVLAGGLIALAVYFGGPAKTATTPTPTTAAAAGAVATPAPPTVGDMRPVDKSDHILGAADAKVTIVEYSDLECPFCHQFHPTLQQALKEYPNDVRWVYRHFPLEAIHPSARISAIGSECASQQGKFWEFIDYIFANTNGTADIAKDKLPDIAKQVGVADIAKFTACLDSKEVSDIIDRDAADAQAAGGQGTPYSILIGPDGQKVPVSGAQPYASVKAQIDKLLTN